MTTKKKTRVSKGLGKENLFILKNRGKSESEDVMPDLLHKVREIAVYLENNLEDSRVRERNAVRDLDEVRNEIKFLEELLGDVQEILMGEE